MHDGIKLAFAGFYRSHACLQALLDSTRASRDGKEYFVELFKDGKWRLGDSDDIDSAYTSPGLLLKIPPMTKKEYDVHQESQRYFKNALDRLKDDFGMEE